MVTTVPIVVTIMRFILGEQIVIVSAMMKSNALRFVGILECKYGLTSCQTKIERW
jgi:hypothetical protein